MNNESDLVSIVVVCYNHSAYVLECLESVLTQKYSNWELIIADDASKDDSVAIIENWIVGNNQIKVKTNYHSTNTGICTVLNECIDLAKGKYLKFIAADDVLHTDLLKEAVDFFEQNDKDFGVVFTNAQFIKSDSSIENRFIIPQDAVVPSGWVRENLQYSNFVPAPSVVLKAEIFTKIGKYDPYIKIEDYDCWLRASRYFRFQYIDKALVFYRIHTSNISHSIDFGNDMIELLIRNDHNGDFALGINKRIRDYYYQGKTNMKVMNHYKTYFKRDKWMVFCMKHNIPYFFYRIIDKLYI